MAKATKKDSKSFEETLWDSANKLRGSVDPYKYKDVVLSLIFLKTLSDKFEEQKEKLLSMGLKEYINQSAFYQKDNIFFLTEEARWDYIQKNAKQSTLALIIDTALALIEKNNPSLKGALPNNYFSGLGIENSKLSALVDTISNLNTIADKSQDVIGRVYEYFIGKFALASGKEKGEFYTPKSVVNLIAEMIEPYRGKIYDPCCGSGGMFVQSMKFVEKHAGETRDIAIYGQESNADTYKLAKMNLAIRGIIGDLGAVSADTFAKDQHPDLKADYIMANPPFNLKDWRAATELTDDPRWDGYDVPPTGNANYAWILHIASKLSENGVAGFLLANGALSGDGTEKAIRTKLIQNHLVEAIIILPRNMFYTTDISVTLWILNKNQKEHVVKHGDIERNYRNRENEVLFMDLRQQGEPFEKKFIQFSDEDIQKFANTYHTWQTYKKAYQNIPEYCYSANLDELKAKDYSLVPSKYIEFINRDENIDFEEKMQSLRSELTTLLQEETQNKADLLKVFKDLGYEIKL